MNFRPPFKESKQILSPVYEVLTLLLCYFKQSVDLGDEASIRVEKLFMGAGELKKLYEFIVSLVES
ncbi:MAG: hypothetical protein QW059_03650 [Nitrososphaerota archaeon]